MTEHNSTDTLYANPLNLVNSFRFDDKVADVFPDMIKRSVPGYATILTMLGDLAARYAQPNSFCYDLGCSLGAATLAMRHQIRAADCSIVSVDNSEAMIKRCQTLIEADSDETPVNVKLENISDTQIENASIVVLNFTLQFIPLAERASLIQRIYNGLLPGGILLLSEKVIFEDSPHQVLMTELYHNFKRANGYSETEIAQKREALETVLIPETLSTHRQRLKSAGFKSADIWFQCLTFASLLAIKSE